MFKFLFFLILSFIIIRAVFSILFRILGGNRFKAKNRSYQQRPNRPKQPETQDERIIEYQKKSFESTEVEDADFIEIKDRK